MVTTYRPKPGWSRLRRSKNRVRVNPDHYQPLSMVDTDVWIELGTGQAVNKPVHDSTSVDQWIEDNWNDKD